MKIKIIHSIILAIACFIVGVEFLFDIKKYFLFYNVLIYLDFFIIVSYILFTIYKIFSYEKSFFDLELYEKAEFFYFALVLITLYYPRLSAGIVIVRIFVGFLTNLFKTDKGTKVLEFLNKSPSKVLAIGFLSVISVGTLLLMMPASTKDAQGASFINALFTITSATCVSGLSVFENLQTYFTTFGQTVILFAMEIGGLGVMVLSTTFIILLNQHIPFKKQAELREILDISISEKLKKNIISIIATAVIIQCSGVIILFIFLSNKISSISERFWWALFHTVSSFCNVGLSLTPNSFNDFVYDTKIIYLFMILITLGGLGFFVISDLFINKIWHVKKIKITWNRLQLQTKIVVLATIGMDILGLLLFLYFEYNGALQNLSIMEKINTSLFYSVNLRSAGFSIVNINSIAAPTILFSLVFMFIGASPGSTAGGIKNTTAVVSLMALFSMLKNRDKVEIMNRTISPAVINRSLSILLSATIIIIIFLCFLLATQNIKFENLLFECISAFGNVGLSINTTMMLDNIGKILIICVMYIGRIGPLTLVLAIAQKKSSYSYSLPIGKVSIG